MYLGSVKNAVSRAELAFHYACEVVKNHEFYNLRYFLCGWLGIDAPTEKSMEWNLQPYFLRYFSAGDISGMEFVLTAIDVNKPRGNGFEDAYQCLAGYRL